jgi:DNA repair exonuclease SbcCD ATPase subunit
MGRVYQSVREVVQGSLSRRALDLRVSTPVTANQDSLSDAIEELDKILGDGIRRLKAAVSEDRAVTLSKTKHAEQVIEGLEANITGLEDRIRQTEDTLGSQRVASQKMEENLRTEIADVQHAVKKKEEALESRISEVNDLKSKLDVMAEKITHLELTTEQARREAASKVQEAEQVIEGLKANIIDLASRLESAEDTVSRKDAAIQNLEKNLSAEIRALQSVVTDKDQALEKRETEVTDLRSKIDVMAEQISQSELAVHQVRREAAGKIQEAEQVVEGLKANIIVLQATRKAQLGQAEQIVGKTESSLQNGTEDNKAEALANIEDQATAEAVAGESWKTVEEKLTTFQTAGVAPIVTEAARETVSPEAFVRIIASFSEFANVIESIASLIVRDHVRTFDESIEEFPHKRLPELLESLSNEISDNKLKADFRERFASVNLG